MINYGPGHSQTAQLVVVKGESADSGLRIVDRYPDIYRMRADIAEQG